MYEEITSKPEYKKVKKELQATVDKYATLFKLTLQPGDFEMIERHYVNESVWTKDLTPEKYIDMFGLRIILKEDKK